MSIRTAYEASLRREGHVEDPAQLEIVARFEDLQDRLLARPARKRGLRALLRGTSDNWPAVKGLYIWGGVGRGKTFLMDLFFDALPIDASKRIHFHRMICLLYTSDAADE